MMMMMNVLWEDSRVASLCFTEENAKVFLNASQSVPRSWQRFRGAGKAWNLRSEHINKTVDPAARPKPD